MVVLAGLGVSITVAIAVAVTITVAVAIAITVAVAVGRFQTRTVENHCHVLQHVLLIEPLHLWQLPTVDVAGTDDEDSQVGNTVDDLRIS